MPVSLPVSAGRAASLTHWHWQPEMTHWHGPFAEEVRMLIFFSLIGESNQHYPAVRRRRRGAAGCVSSESATVTESRCQWYGNASLVEMEVPTGIHVWSRCRES